MWPCSYDCDVLGRVAGLDKSNFLEMGVKSREERLVLFRLDSLIDAASPTE